jgi:hypothetical protein
MRSVGIASMSKRRGYSSRPERAFASGKPAIVNVKTDYRARATTMRFTNYMTWSSAGMARFGREGGVWTPWNG